MTLGLISEDIQDRLQRLFNRPVEISPAPKTIGGGVYCIAGIKMEGAYKVADIIGQSCYKEGLAPCAVALAQLLSANASKNPAELIISLPPTLNPNAANIEKMSDVPGDVFYPPPPDNIPPAELRIGTVDEYVQLIERHARQIRATLSSKHRGRQA